MTAANIIAKPDSTVASQICVAVSLSQPSMPVRDVTITVIPDRYELAACCDIDLLVPPYGGDLYWQRVGTGIALPAAFVVNIDALGILPDDTIKATVFSMTQFGPCESLTSSGFTVD